MTGRLIVAANGGPQSAAALDWSIRWATTHSMAIEVCTVVDDDWYGVDYRVLERDHQRVLDAARERIEALAPTLAASFVLHRGKIVDSLVMLSRHSDLLVIGSRTSALFEGIIHGTLALKVAERSTVPVVVVPEGWKEGTGRIVLGVDDETDADALTFAARAASDRVSGLVVVHAIQVPVPYSPYDGGRSELLDEQQQIARKMVTDKCADLRERYPRLRVEGAVSTGNPSLVVVRAARDASLVVVGTHARGVLLGVLLGSVGRDLLMNMPCPVAVVPLATPASTDDDLALMTSLAQ